MRMSSQHCCWQRALLLAAALAITVSLHADAAATGWRHLLQGSTGDMGVYELAATLTGGEVTAESDGPIKTDASGTVSATLVGNTLVVYGSYKGITPLLRDLDKRGPRNAGIHLHPGAKNVTSTYVYGIPLWVSTGNAAQAVKSGRSSDASFKGYAVVSDELKTMLLAGHTYVDIHTKQHPDGEIRGQLLQVAKVEPAFDNTK